MSRHRGDTIVEVLIAIAVLGAALGGAFAISNASQKKVQANHERYQAQLIINRQAELLRSEYVSIMQGNPATGRATFAASHGNGSYCTNSWTTSSCPIDGLYDVSVSRLPNGSAQGDAQGLQPLTYRIYIEWDSLVTVGKKDNMVLIYGL